MQNVSITTDESNAIQQGGEAEGRNLLHNKRGIQDVSIISIKADGNAVFSLAEVLEESFKKELNLNVKYQWDPKVQNAERHSM